MLHHRYLSFPETTGHTQDKHQAASPLMFGMTQSLAPGAVCLGGFILL